MTMTVPLAPARFALAPAGRSRSRIDGAWWPRSRDLAAELPSLSVAMGDVGVITRATVNPTHWQGIPRQVRVSGRALKVGWFADEQDEHEIMLLSYHAARWELLVVPPETDPAVAELLMDAASSPDDLRGAGELIRAMVPPARSARADATGRATGRARPGHRRSA
ncbi:DUF5994 family protein [Streptomycetaceae bacterium NBC_01309]